MIGVHQKLAFYCAIILYPPPHVYNHVIDLLYAAVCAGDCQNGGVCDAPNHCSCPPDFEGSHCDRRKSQPLSSSVHYSTLSTMITCVYSSAM